jgi:hypothetical protein
MSLRVFLCSTRSHLCYFFHTAGSPLVPTESTDDHCNKTVDIYVDVSSPPVTYLNRYRPLTCWYRFKSIKGIPKDWVLRLTFKRFKVGTLINSTHCDGGYLQVKNFHFHNFLYMY